MRQLLLLCLFASLCVAGCGNSGNSLIGTWESNQPDDDGPSFIKTINANGTMAVTMKLPGKEDQKYSLTYKQLSDDTLEVPAQTVLLFGRDYAVPAHQMKMLDAQKLKLTNGSKVSFYNRQ